MGRVGEFGSARYETVQLPPTLTARVSIGDFYIKIQQEDYNDYTKALDYISKLDFKAEN